MKTIIPTLILAFSLNCFAQEGYHSLTAAEYANVKFQGVSFEAIKATEGNVQAMRELFTSSTVSNHPDSFTIDEFGSEIGEPIYAMYDGFIYSSKYDKYGAGYYTRIQSTINGETIITSYFHLQEGNRELSTNNPLNYVKAGDIIGYQGESGNLASAIESGGVDSHVHIEVRVHDGSDSWSYDHYNLVDPREYLETNIDDSGISTFNINNCN